MIDKTTGEIRFAGNLTLGPHLNLAAFWASPDAAQWTIRRIDLIEVYARPLLDEKGRKVTALLSFSDERLRSIDLYCAHLDKPDFPDIYTQEFMEFHEQLLREDLGDNHSQYPWYQFSWGVVRNRWSHIQVIYGLTLAHDPTLKVGLRVELWDLGDRSSGGNWNPN